MLRHSIALALLVALPSAGWAFEFALDELQVSGGGTFFDDFGDGLRNSPPTSDLQDWGDTVTTESGGFLFLSDADGVHRFDFGPGLVVLEDSVGWVGSIDLNATGESVVSAAFRPDVPGPDSAFGLSLDVPANSPVLFFGASQFVTPGGQLGVGFANPGLLGLTGFDPIDAIDVSGNVILQVVIDHATRTMIPRYSVNGGTTFVEAASWADPPELLQLPFPSGEDVATVSVHGTALVPEPSVTLLLGTALAVLALRRGKR